MEANRPPRRLLQEIREPPPVGSTPVLTFGWTFGPTPVAVGPPG
jgi:hypothetical protein